MLNTLSRRERRSTLLERYGLQMGAVVERRRAELALTAAKIEAEKVAALASEAMAVAQSANRAKTEFLANMSHELRTPLNAIIGFSEMMTEGLVTPDRSDKHLEYARDINRSGRHLLEMIDDILDMAKIESGRLVLDEQVVDFNRIVSASMVLIKEAARQSGLTLRSEIPAKIPQLHVDERKIRQVLINLLANAIKFTPGGGVITLRVGPAEDGGFLFSVTDSGIGIAEKDIERALAPFTQIGRITHREAEGTGLGLPITKALVEIHGGSLTLESKVGTGTRATVRLPVARIRMPARSRAAGATATTLPSAGKVGDHSA